MEQDVHAPGYDARGVAFPGVNLFVQLGHGRDYAWSATTSAQDIVDTFAVDRCCDDDALPLPRPLPRDRGARAHERVAARTRPTRRPPGSETLSTERTRARHRDRARRGARQARALHAAAQHLRARDRLRPRVLALQRPRQDPQARATSSAPPALIPFTFNWFYVDTEHIAYQNAGANPLRAARRGRRACRSLGRAQYEWRNWDPGETRRSLVESSTPRRKRPHVIDQAYFADWNGKQAHGYGAADGNWGYGPVYRSRLLDDRVERLIARRPQGDAAAARRGDGRRGDGRPARRRGAAVGAARARHARATRRCATPSTSCARGCATAPTGSTPTATAPTSTPTRSGSSTPGGRAG